MRMMLSVMGVALLVAGACAPERNRVADLDADDGISAERLGGGIEGQGSIVHLLSPEERVALDRAGLIRHKDEQTALADVEGIDDEVVEEGEDEGVTSAEVTGTMMSLLAVGISLGVMVAPYLLF